MRCDVGRALCGAVEEVRKSIRGAFGPLTPGRPPSQLEHIRKVLDEHDAQCFECGNGGAG